MITQRLVLDGGYPDGVWACAGCRRQLTDGEITHDSGCTELARVAAAERARCACLAEQVTATYWKPDGTTQRLPFADLLRAGAAVTAPAAGPVGAFLAEVRKRAALGDLRTPAGQGYALRSAADVPVLAAMAEAVLALHRVEGGGEYCVEDGFHWPCRTVRDLESAQGGAP